MTSREDFKQANRRAKDLKARIPRAVSAHYDRKTGRIVIQLSSNLIVSFSPADAQGLEGAEPSQLKEIEITPSGFGIHFPAIDADERNCQPSSGLCSGDTTSFTAMAGIPPGSRYKVGEADLEELVELVTVTVRAIDKQVKDGLIDDEEAAAE